MVVAGGQLSEAGLGWVGLLEAVHLCRHFSWELILRPSLKDGSCLGEALFVAMAAKCKRVPLTLQTHFLPLFVSCLLPSHCPEQVTWLGPKLRGRTAKSYGEEHRCALVMVKNWC